MQTPPLLTIAIPTWNRAKFLEHNLNQLRSEMKTIPAGIVEIMVSDNCSHDNTAEVVANAIATGLPIRYLRNEKNIGWGGNFCQCFEKAEGQYVLLLGDDDLLVDGALKLLIERASSKNYGVICLRPYGFDNEFRNEYPGNFGNEKSYTDAGEFLVGIGALMTMISACVVNRELLRGLPMKEYFSSDLAHLYLVLHAALQAKENLFINKYLVACKRNNSANYDFAEVFVDQLWDILQSYQSRGLGIHALSLIETRMLFSYYPFYLLLIRLERAGNNEETYRRFKNRFQHRLLFRFWLAPILTLPRGLAIPLGALTTLIGRISDGEFRRGQAFFKRKVLQYLN